jgi:hypothetical protein
MTAEREAHLRKVVGPPCSELLAEIDALREKLAEVERDRDKLAARMPDLDKALEVATKAQAQRDAAVKALRNLAHYLNVMPDADLVLTDEVKLAWREARSVLQQAGS